MEPDGRGDRLEPPRGRVPRIGTALIRPAPETAAQLAERAVAFVESKFGIPLQYNPPSLILVDALIDKIKAAGASEQQASGLLLEMGCYVGEVFVRHTRATWRLTVELGMSRVCAFPIAVALPGVVGCNPIGMVFDRFRMGEDASVAASYQAALEVLPPTSHG